MRQSPEVMSALALTRFGLGARPGESDRLAGEPTVWLTAQVRAEGAPNPDEALPGTRDRLDMFRSYQQERRQRRRTQGRADQPSTTEAPMAEAPMADTAADPAQARFDTARMARRDLRQDVGAEFLARARHGATTEAGFAERWALFWANTFAVSATKFQTGLFAGPFEREAIRPNVFGSFDRLVLAAEQHPAMLTYLDQAQSVGPNSRAGQRRSAGLNENLAREVLELHTLGTDGGYGQDDVTELARALTGWAPPLGRSDTEAAFQFRPQVHEPGARTVLGVTYAEGGRAQGEAILRDLARHPATAKRAARRIATHFVSDTPPQALVDRLERTWLDSEGALDRVALALIAAPEAWDPAPAKIKTPYEFVISTHRALGTAPQQIGGLQNPLTEMGQPPFSPPSPEGWPDTAADWAGPDALVKRLDWARQVGARTGQADPVAVARAALGPRLGERTLQTVQRAESRAEGMILFLMSPEFQRR